MSEHMTEMKKVQSSIINEIGYDSETEILTIKFNGGKTYVYKNVPKEKALAVMESESIGKAFHAEIKGQYEAAPVEEKPKPE